MSGSLVRGLAVTVALVLGAVAVGCGGGEDDKPPQLGVHQWPVAFQNFAPASAADGTPAPAAQQFQVIVLNLGGGDLEITDMEVRGDVNCALTPAPVFDAALPIHLTSSDQAFLNLDYVPGGTYNASEAGNIKDQISIALTSNSADASVFEISVCGCIVGPGVDPTSAPLCECNLNEVPQGNCGS